MAKKAQTAGSKRRSASSAKASKAKTRKAKAKLTAAKRPASRRASGKAGRATAPSKKRPRLKKTLLGAKQLREFREMLLAKRHELVGDMSGMEEEATRQQGSGNLSSMPTHMADVGTDNFEHEFTLGLLESEQAVLHEIDEALRRIENKTYGICLGTSEGIPLARLRAKPWAKYTVEYTRLLEKGLVRAPDDTDEDEPGNDEDEE